MARPSIKEADRTGPRLGLSAILPISEVSRMAGPALVTLDKDFGEMAIVRGIPHSGILRLVNVPAREQGAVCASIIGQYGKELQSGSIITAEPGRLRIRPPNEEFE